jgi:ribonuclease-3 family protein
MKDLFRPELTGQEIEKISSLGLAYIGDAVFELFIRLRICGQGKLTSANMHESAVHHVNAHAQSVYAKHILPELTDEELRIFKRGRNAKVHSVPKNADLSEYHAATGLEALIGYLYLRGDSERLEKLLEFMMIGE